MTRRSEAGFTLMELMIVLGIFGLVLAASWGNFQSLIRNQRLTGATNQVVTHLRLAREKAVAEGNNFVVTFRIASNDYQVWDDEASDAVFGSQDSRRVFSMPTGTVLQNPSFFGSNRITFRPDGTCDATGSVEITNRERLKLVNVLASTGKVTVTTP
jgi:type II secretion system protein H